MADLIYHDDTLTYTSYLGVDKLLTLQQQRAKPAHHDELLFIISHQVYELWFKQMLHEVVEICDRLDHDDAQRAAHYFDRLHKIQHLLIEQLPVLETMFAVDFAQFRDHLRPASGFQSVQFRKLEFLCGAKNPAMMKLAGEDQETRSQLDAALKAPSVYDHLLRYLARPAGGSLAIPRSVLDRDTSRVHEPSEETAKAIMPLYQDPQKHYLQFRLCEHFVEFEERFQLWRFHHVKMVERMIGSMPGTGGSAGAKYLAGTLEIKFFPELWMLRSYIGGSYGQAAVGADSPAPGAPGGGCPMGFSAPRSPSL
jgi:tryptophan 2,3-dioxygenase